jgi:hypothetical protein
MHHFIVYCYRLAYDYGSMWCQGCDEDRRQFWTHRYLYMDELHQLCDGCAILFLPRVQDVDKLKRPRLASR